MRFLISLFFIIYTFSIVDFSVISFFDLNFYFVFCYIIIIITIICSRFASLFYVVSNKTDTPLIVPISISLRGLAVSIFPLFGFSEISKFVDLRQIIGRSNTAQILILERALGLIASFLTLLILFNIILFGNKFYFYFLSIECFLIVFFFNKKIFIGFINKIMYLNFITHKILFIENFNTKILLPFFLSILSQWLTLYLIFIISLSIFEVTDILKYLFFVQISNIITSLPISVAGIGIRDFLFLNIIQPFFYFSFEQSVKLTLSLNLIYLSVPTLAFLISLIFFNSRNFYVKN